jgi:hypothetical protein
MNAKQAIDKIAELLKFTFKSEKFYSTKLQDGTEVTNNLDEDFKIGQVLYVVGESTLTPAPVGTHITRENLKVTVDSESVIIAIESGDVIAEDEAESTETQEEQVLKSNSFEVSETGIVEEPEEEVEKEEGANLDDLLKLLVPMVEEMKKLKTQMDSMKEMMSAEVSALKTDFDSFKKSPEKFSVVEKKTYKESFDDYKVELIKSLRK